MKKRHTNTLIRSIGIVAFGTLIALPPTALAQDGFEDAIPDFLAPYDADLDGVFSEEELQIARQHRQERREHAHEMWDFNGDGVLSDEEVELAQQEIMHEILAARDEHFTTVDLSADDHLDQSEFGQIPGMERLPVSAVASLFDFVDVDDDNLASRAEFLAAFEPPTPDGDKDNQNAGDVIVDLRALLLADFQSMDTDTSGGVDIAEYLAFHGGVDGLPELEVVLRDIFNGLDTDTSGTLSSEEYVDGQLPVVPDPFADFDLNEDGYIDRIEMTAFFNGAPDEVIDDFLLFHDANRDGKLSRREFEHPIGPDPIAFADMNGDDALDRDEIAMLLGGGSQQEVDDFLEVLDENDDGKVSREEIEGPAPDPITFAETDTNSDGSLDRTEIAALLNGANEDGIDDYLALHDADEDGAVSQVEFENPLDYETVAFGNADTNADGGLSREEIGAAIIDDGFPPEVIDEFFVSFDIDVDGKLSLEELLGFPAPLRLR